MNKLQTKPRNAAHSWSQCPNKTAPLQSKNNGSPLTQGPPLEASNEIIYVSDEDVGICGGVITPSKRMNTSKPAFLKDWTALSPFPMFRPNVRTKPSNLRSIVIDGSNVCFHKGLYCGSKLETCVRTFIHAGHEVKAFIPQFRTMHSSTRDFNVLDELERSGLLVLTPSRSVDFQRLTPYDDRFIVEYANITGAIIVSNDRFSDLLRENDTWRETIRRRLSFRWYDHCIFFPKYPLGEKGPTLSEFLRTPETAVK